MRARAKTMLGAADALLLDNARRIGRLRSMFDEAKAESVLQQIASGKSTRETGTPSSTICTWAATNPSFAEQYARAMALRADVHASRIEDAANELLDGTRTDAQAARTAIDALKWTASKLNPKRYGDRIQADVDLNVTVTIEDPRINALQAKLITRALPKPDG